MNEQIKTPWAYISFEKVTLTECCLDDGIDKNE